MIEDAKIPEVAVALGIPVSRLQRAVIDPQSPEERRRGICEVHGVVRDGQGQPRRFVARRSAAGRGPQFSWLITVPSVESESGSGVPAGLTAQQAQELRYALAALDEALHRLQPLLADVRQRL